MSDLIQLRYLEPGKLRFFKAGATLRVTLADEFSCLQATVVRIFPLTNPDRYFSVRDGGGNEVGILTSLEGLDPESLAYVHAALVRHYMVARLKKVIKVQERFGIVEWDVETDRGECRFSTRDLRDHVLRLPSHHYMLVDVDGNRFEVKNLLELDEASQTALLRHL